MTLRRLTEHHLEFLSVKGGCTGSSESTLVKMPHCWKSNVATHLLFSGCAVGSVVCGCVYTVNSTIFGRILFSRIMLKDILAMLK